MTLTQENNPNQESSKGVAQPQRFDKSQKIEIAHDILALKVFEKIDVEERMRLKISQFIGDRYAYHQETGEFLSKNELIYIDPYLDQIELEAPVLTFIRKSRYWAKKHFRRRTIVSISTMAVLLGFVIFAVGQWIVTVKVTKKIATHIVEDAEKDIYKLRIEEAKEKYEVAFKLHDHSDLISRELLELAFFYGEINEVDTALMLAKQSAELHDSDTIPHMDSVHQILEGLHTRDKKFREKLNLALRLMDTVWFDSLDHRYYPSMVKVSGRMIEMNAQNVYPFTQDNLEETSHLVEISDFYMSNTEVTFWQYNLFCEATGKDNVLKRIKPQVGWGVDGDNPAIFVSWFHAAQYANWLSKQLGFDTVYVFKTDEELEQIRSEANGFRLPTEVEWEYAAAGGVHGYDDRGKLLNKWSGTSDLQELSNYVWYYGNRGIERIDTVASEEEYVARTMPVATKKPNQLGLYDMNGNAREWCQDAYSDHLMDELDQLYEGDEIDNLAERMLRGGSWKDSLVRNLTVTARVHIDPLKESITDGFRLVRNHP